MSFSFDSFSLSVQSIDLALEKFNGRCMETRGILCTSNETGKDGLT